MHPTTPDAADHHPPTGKRPVLLVCLMWLGIAAIVALVSGSASALFLWLLELATSTREQHLWLIWLMPVAGALTSLIYLKWGKLVEGGNNLLLETIHQPSTTIPLRMAPLVMLSTVVSHLFGASVGREGTAVQMGGAMADNLSHHIRLAPAQRRIVLMMGISAGFGSVFGTPLAGAIFGLEVLAVGRIRHDGLLPCLLSSVLADLVCRQWGILHAHYIIGTIPPMTLTGLLSILLAGLFFGGIARGFSVATHALTAVLKKHLTWSPLRTLVAGVVIALVMMLSGAQHYAGLGVPDIQQSFLQALPGYTFLVKAFYTVASLAGGFKGGEVTPLFYIGATSGNALAAWLPLPTGLLAGAGMMAVFAGAANTPVASGLMAMELFGTEAGIWTALACACAYAVSGHHGIYRSQQIDTRK